MAASFIISYKDLNIGMYLENIQVPLDSEN